MQFNADFKLEMTEVTKDCNAFTMLGNKPFGLKAVLSKAQGGKEQEYEISGEYEPRYAWHCGAGKPVGEMKETLLFETDDKQWIVYLLYKIPIFNVPICWTVNGYTHFHNGNYTTEMLKAKCKLLHERICTVKELREVRARIGQQLMQHCVRMVNREEIWDERWKERSNMLCRLLYWIFKDMSPEFRFDIFMEVRKGWCALRHADP